MHPAEAAWREVRKARTYPQVIARAQTWMEVVWPEAKTLGHTRKSTRPHPVPQLEVDDSRGRHTSGYYVDDSITLPSRRVLQAILDRYLLGASPTLDWTMIDQTVPEYARSIIVHEMRHAFDYVDGLDPLGAHDKRWFTRLTKLEAIYTPLGL